jgi:short-subunit dehydrogenase
MSFPSFAGTRVLITGASAGLGEEFARQLVFEKVAQIVITARRGDRLDKLKKMLKELSPNPVQIDCIVGDLSQADGVTKLIAAMEAISFSPDILINNAGFGDLGLFESAEQSKIDSMLSLNIVALTQLCHYYLPKMLKAKKGWICNVGSTAGVITFLPTFAVYAATKAYVNSFSEALRIECLGSGVNVSVLAPGPVETEFGDVAGRSNSERKFEAPDFLMVHKAQVVHDALRGLARNQGRVIPGIVVRLSMLWLEGVPAFILRFFMGFQKSAFIKERAQRGA